MSKSRCIVKNCENTCSERSQFNICAPCRNRIGYALLQPPGWVHKRQTRLELYADRLEYLGYRK